MVFIPGTYVRAAGIQSEIGKMAVNRVACLENDFRRMVHMAKMDMKKTLREMKHNREMMRRSIGRYRKKLREYQIVRNKRYLTELDANTVNLGKVNKENEEEDSTVLVLPKINPKKNNKADNKASITKSSKTKSAIAASEKRASTPNESRFRETDVSAAQVLLEDEIHLPPIDSKNRHTLVKEDQEIAGQLNLNTADNTATRLTNSPSNDTHLEPEASKDVNATSKEQTGAKTPNRLKVKSGTYVNDDQIDETSAQASVTSSLEVIPKVPKKRRTGAVNLTNIMRLQYSTNLKALFKTVDVLARVHGINGAVSDREAFGPTAISKHSEVRRRSQASQLTTGSSTFDRKGVSRVSVKGSFYRESDTSRLSQISGPKRISDSGRTFQLSPGRRLSQVSDEHPKHLLPSDYLYNMKYGYTEIDEPSAKEGTNDTRPPLGNTTPSTIKSNVHEEKLTEKGSRKVSRISTHSSLYPSRHVSTVDGPISSSLSIESSESRSDRTFLRGDRSMAKVSQSSLPQPYSDDYFERANSERGKDVEWQTAFRKLKHVHFLDSFETTA